MTRLLGGSLTARLTLLFSSSATIVLVVLGVTVGRAVDQHFVEQDLEALNGKMILVRHAFEKVDSPAQLAQLPEQLDSSLVGHHGLAVKVVGADGRTFFNTHGVDFPASVMRDVRSSPRKETVMWRSAHGHYRAIVGRVQTQVPAWPSATVAIAIEISHHEAFMYAFRRTMWVIVATATLLLGFLAWVATRSGLAPLRQLVAGAAQVTASRLHHRLPTDNVPVEVAELSRTLNEMLARLEDSFRRLSEFSSDIAHELRTPISNLMTQTHVSLTRARTAEQYQDILSSNAEELDRLARTVSDMLFLAKADNGLIVPSQEEILIADEVKDLFDFYEALAESKRIQLVSEGAARVSGDRLMLRRALSNLISNAIRYSAEGSDIAVRTREDGDVVSIAVCNVGETIPAEHLPRLFDRFYRADASRHRTTEGAGLGLAITASIVAAHGGFVSAASEDGATCFTIKLPRSPSLRRIAGVE